MHHLNWYQNEEKKREQESKSTDISFINQELKVLLQRTQSFINREEYEDYARKASSVVQQSSIWNVGYINNMENERVAVEQALLLKAIFERDAESIPHSDAMDYEVESLMRRLSNITPSLYASYMERLKQL